MRTTDGFTRGDLFVCRWSGCVSIRSLRGQATSRLPCTSSNHESKDVLRLRMVLALPQRRRQVSSLSNPVRITQAYID